VPKLGGIGVWVFGCGDGLCAEWCGGAGVDEMKRAVGPNEAMQGVHGQAYAAEY